MNIVLIGMRGSGKSTVGRLLAGELKMDFMDLDQEIILRADKTIAEIVAAGGWERFRELESQAARRITASDNLVLATGGGIVSREQNVRVLKAWGTLVWLRADAAKLYARIATETGRPPLTESEPETEIHTVLRAREALYAAAADLKVETGGREPAEIASGISERLTPSGAV